MFKDFLDEIGLDVTSETMALESLAGFYGIDDFDIATEGIKELGTKIKEKMAGLGRRIKDFVLKVKNWIAGKLLKLMNKSNADVDAKVWKNCQTILKELDKVQAAKLLLSTSVLNADNLEATEKNLEKIKNMHTTLSDVLDRVKASTAYKEKDERGGNTVKVNMSALSKEKSSLEETVKALEKAEANTTRVASVTKDPENASIGAKVSSAFFETVALAIEKVNMQISVINTISAAASNYDTRGVKQPKYKDETD